MQIEDLGFCAKGEGPAFVRSHTFTADGSFPINTSGGQLSVGQAGAAGGYLGLVEAIRQLTGEPLGRGGEGCEDRAGERLRHDQLRPRAVLRRRDPAQSLEPTNRGRFSDEHDRTAARAQSARTRSCARGCRRCRRAGAAASRWA